MAGRATPPADDRGAHRVNDLIGHESSSRLRYGVTVTHSRETGRIRAAPEIPAKTRRLRTASRRPAVIRTPPTAT